MRKDKDKAISMRKLGKSYNEIRRALKIPKSTLSFWLKNINLSKKARNNLKNGWQKVGLKKLLQMNHNRTLVAQASADFIQKKASRDIKKIDKKTLFFLGLALYWAEGYKSTKWGKWRCVDFTNSDPMSVKLMMKFFREICFVKDDKFCFQLMVHNKLQSAKALKFWSKLARIPQKQFMNVFVWKYKRKVVKSDRVLPNGTIHVRIYDVKLFHKILGWIDGLKEQIGAWRSW